MRAFFHTFVICFFLTTQALAQDDGSTGGSEGGNFELGPIAGLLLPGNFPGADEVYFGFGPNFAVHTSYMIIEFGGLFASRQDRLVNQTNHLLFVPVSLRMDIDLKGFIAFGLAGGHFNWYRTHYSNGRRISAMTGGFDIGGGIIIPDPGSFNIRIDMRFFFNPGQTLLLGGSMYWRI